MVKNKIQMWMVKDSKGSILPGYGYYLTKKEGIIDMEARFDNTWRAIKTYGWRIVKVQITEITGKEAGKNDSDKSNT